MNLTKFLINLFIASFLPLMNNHAMVFVEVMFILYLAEFCEKKLSHNNHIKEYFYR